MEKALQLQFQSLPAEAQNETLWRLALSGLTVEQVSERTGWSPERIRRAISPEPVPAMAPWRTAGTSLPRVTRDHQGATNAPSTSTTRPSEVAVARPSVP
jgi:hypothetical protein